MKIKKVDDKPMVIHTKQKAKIHSHEPKTSAIKGANVYTVNRSPTAKKVSAKEGLLSGMRRAVRKSNESIKVKNTTLRSAGMTGAKVASDQIEGGQELQQSAMLAYEATRPVVGTASKGAELFKRQAAEQAKKRIKKINAGKKNAKKTAKGSAKKAAKDASKAVAKETAKTTAKAVASTTAKAATTAAATTAGTAISPGAGTAIGFAIGEAVGTAVGMEIERRDMVADTRARKIKFFLDKMNAEDKQKDSLTKLVKDLIVRKTQYIIRQIMAVAGPFLLILVLLVAMITVPVVAVVGTIYNSPFAIFLPPLEEGDTVTTVAGSYVAEFNREVSDLVSSHSGCAEGRIVYVDYEGTDIPNNYYDILAVYMVKHGVGDTAVIMNDTSKDWLQTVVNDMCSYTTSVVTETETVSDENGGTTTVSTTCLHVNVTLKTWQDMVLEYGFSTEEEELLREFMQPENLAMLGYAPGGGGGNMQSALSDVEIDVILSGISDSTQRAVCDYALHRVGYPYSQVLRDSGTYYDCSSLAYYSWQSAGVNISFGGATTAAAEAQGLSEADKTVTYSEMQPGDLIFYSTSSNGRFLNITHVAVYVGNGRVVEALNESLGVVYQDTRTANIVMIGRPD